MEAAPDFLAEGPVPLVNNLGDLGEEDVEQTAAAAAPAPLPLPTGPTKAASRQDAQKRLMRDFKKIQQEEMDGITASPHDDDLFLWRAIIFGPENTAWEGGIFHLEIAFTDEYPMAPPKVRFLTKIFHPNVYTNGAICVDLMKSNWSPAIDVVALLHSLRSLIADPNPNSAANCEAAEMYLKKRSQYDEIVAKIVEESLLAEDDS